MVEVVSVYTPRPEHPKWCDYLTGLKLQKQTAEFFECRHVVVTDTALPDFAVFHVELPESLMHAILVGQIAYLEHWNDDSHLLLLDADCLIGRNPAWAFDGSFDLGLTWRPDPRCMINNGAMYVAAGSKAKVLPFFRRALELCREHWGGDQEAISLAAQPDPLEEGALGERCGAMVRFLPLRMFNCAPGREFAKHLRPAPYVVHFKGERRKGWMTEYATRHILIPPEV